MLKGKKCDEIDGKFSEESGSLQKSFSVPSLCICTLFYSISNKIWELLLWFCVEDVRCALCANLSWIDEDEKMKMTGYLKKEKMMIRNTSQWLQSSFFAFDIFFFFAGPQRILSLFSAGTLMDHFLWVKFPKFFSMKVDRA